MSSEEPWFAVRDHVARITLNRPAQRNAMTGEMRERLGEHLQRIADDPDIRVGVIAGNGGVFCAGADLKQRAASGGARAEDSSPASVLAPGPNARWSTLKVAKPLIAAIDGYCLAGGMELALACSFRVAVPAARMGVPEIKLGAIPGDGGTQRLPRAVGKAKAMEMCLTGRMMDAEEADSSGLVARVVPADELLDAAMKTADTIAAKSLPVSMICKEAVDRAYEVSLSEGLRFERRLFHSVFATEDQKEGMAAFADKRKANWQNK